ncbi:helix-turn-helix domain-containing protein [Eubacterium aggregans]|uniref:helix-turn-helix domain-containing protein n=1 Tax=Eubacterium aggregans TaxID=81409 RepID=UPI003F2C00B3
MKDNNIGNAIKTIRKKKGLTQTELGEKIGVGAVAVGQWEMGKRYPRKATIERLSEALEMDLLD